MLARVILPLMTIVVSLSMHGQSLAQTRTDNVCWADSKGRCPPPWNGNDVSLIACGTGGHSGFNPTYACQQICGADQGPRCRITPGPGGDGGACGYRAARIDCF